MNRTKVILLGIGNFFTFGMVARNARKKREQEEEEKFRKRQSDMAKLLALNEEARRIDEDVYGASFTKVSLNRREFEKFLDGINSKCKVDAWVQVNDVAAGGFLYYKHEFAELPANNVVAFFDRVLNKELATFLQGNIAFYDFPSVEYREKNGRKFACLSATGGSPAFLFKMYKLFVRT